MTGGEEVVLYITVTGVTNRLAQFAISQEFTSRLVTVVARNAVDRNCALS